MLFRALMIRAMVSGAFRGEEGPWGPTSSV
jgi:hypothetical protein